MCKKGRNTTRLGSLQANGAGGSPSALVEGWCEAISHLLLDVFCICETRLAPAWKHSLIENLFQQRGYKVISHNRSWVDALPDYSSNSSGVIIGVPLSTPGGLSLVNEDTFGRAIAACIPFGSDSTLRFVGLYGPSAAMTPRFPFHLQGIIEERASDAFISEQMEWSFRQGWFFAIAGDLNPFSSLLRDREGGDFVLRNESLAISLMSRGAVDTFRWRHPDLRAFSYVHPNGTASRLDQIWVYPPAMHQVPILNAAIVDDPRHCRDQIGRAHV
jgi:hypothetical protein